MLRLAMVFIVIALIAALFGFGVIASPVAGGAKIIFYVFFVGAVLSFLVATFGSRSYRQKW